MSTQHLSGAQLTSFSLGELTQAADMLQAAGQYQEAIDLYCQWLQHGKDENKHLAWFNYGWLLQKQNKLTEAANAQSELMDKYASYISGNSAMA